MRTLLLILASTSVAFAQASPNLQFRGRERPGHATVEAQPTSLGVKAGARVALFVDVTPNPNIHVYAPGSKDFIPITVRLDPQANIKVGKVTYPKSEMMTFADEKVPVFQKPFRLTQEVTLTGTIEPGTTMPVNGTVSFQACDDKVCFPPERAPVTWTLTVQ
jgi:DsbC/DsbD-like thiol-disulfide interchange protein